MALVYKDRVRETTTTTGTGTLTLAGAVAQYQAFSAIGNANTCRYALVDANGTGWEVGVGTYTLSGTTLARTSVLASSNSGSAITLSAGTHSVFCVADASSFPAASLVANTFTRLQTITQGTANEGIIASTGHSLTGSTQLSLIDLAGTWNTTGIVQSAIKLNITDTASSAASMLANLQVGGTSIFGFRTSGLAIAGGSNAAWASNQFGDGSGDWGTVLGTASFGISTGGMILSSTHSIAWSDNASSLAGSRDFRLFRVAAQVMALLGVSTAGAAIEFTEMTAPSAGAANTCRLYTEDNGGGKTRLMALFNTGAAQQVAIQP